MVKEYNKDCQIYHLSKEYLDGKSLKPRIPSNTMWGEDRRHKRVCFSTSIVGCIRALPSAHGEYFVYVPEKRGDTKVFVPSMDEVPDVKWTREKWVRKKVKVRCIGKLKVLNNPVYDSEKFTFRWLEEYIY